MFDSLDKLAKPADLFDKTILIKKPFSQTGLFI